ncbi:MAG: protease modulator HflK [Verrucomicrobia bacterium]|nr:protease modulator HflK [Verrucomicrobiota bacterium]
MERNIQKVGVVNLVALFFAAAASFAVARFSASLAGQISSVFLGLGFLAAAVSYFQMRLEDRERLEKLEFDELNKSRGSSTMFTTTEAEVFPARRAREQFERFMVPAFTVILFLLQAGVAFVLWSELKIIAAEPLRKPLVAMALYGLFALVLFLLGKYSAGIARLEGQRLLRPGASYLLLGAYLCFAVVGCIVAVEAGFLRVDFYAAHAFSALLTLAAVETFINLVLEIYRPRLKGQLARLLYESRLVGLLSQPEGLITTAAQALDYQFGFKVSDTWVYRFLEKAIAWLILLQFGALLLSSCFTFIQPGEEGLLERFGSPVAGREVLQPGPHLKAPWPIDRVIRFHTQQIQNFNIGFTPDEDEEHEKTIVWTVKHFKEGTNLVLVAARDSAGSTTGTNDQAVPVSLLTAGIPVQYQISNVGAWATNYTDAGQMLEQLAAREVVRYFVGVDLNEVISTGRQAAADALRERIQQRADELKLGVSILFVGMQDIHPPTQVADKYEEVVGALQVKEAKILDAEGYRAKEIPLAKARAEKAVHDAESYRFQTVPVAIAEAAQFTNQVAAFKAAPKVYTARSYFQTLVRGASAARKYVLMSTNTQDSITINLEDKLYKDILDIQVAPGLKAK